MIRRLIPLVVAIVLVVGCKKKPGDSDGGPADDGKVDSDPNATYTIKLRDTQQGDKYEVTENETMNQEFTGGGKSEKMANQKKY